MPWGRGEGLGEQGKGRLAARARKEQDSTEGAWSGWCEALRMWVGELRGRRKEGGCVILHPDGWFQQQPRQVNSGAGARQCPQPPCWLCTGDNSSQDLMRGCWLLLPPWPC